MKVDREALRDVSWWHWAGTVPLLVGHFAGVAWALAAAAMLCAAVGCGFLVVTGSVRAFPVQIRVGYLVLLGVGVLPWMEWIHWVQLCGTSAMVMLGYCPLARMLMLLPWNRKERLDLRLVRHVFLVVPTGGGLVQAILVEEEARGESGALSCSLRFGGVSLEREVAPLYPPHHGVTVE